MDAKSLLIAVPVGMLLFIVLMLVAARLYADAMANGRDGEAGFWGFLALGP